MYEIATVRTRDSARPRPNYILIGDTPATTHQIYGSIYIYATYAYISIARNTCH